MNNLPLTFESKASANGHHETPWTLQAGAYQATCAIPTEFGGTGGAASPEDFFLQAAISCFIGTFKVIAKGSKLSFTDLQVSGRLIVDKNDENKVVMKTIHLNINITNPDRADRLQMIVDKAIKGGFILNSIKSEVTYSLEIETNL